MKTKIKAYTWGLSLSWLALAIPLTHAQTEDDEEDVFELNPFVVESETDEGYRATATLAGTRVKTDLRDLASSVSVVTKQLLTDTNATDNTSLLVYTTNTEVGTQGGNFAGVGNTQGVGEGRNLSAPNTNTRVRGLDAADNTRNFFLTDIPWDSYNTDRVDLQRGPNSILFGVGSPAGIINTTTIIPKFQDANEVQFRFDKYGSVRNVLDLNRVLVDDVLAIRVALLYDKEKYKQEPAFEKDKRAFAAITYTPDLFGRNAYTRIAANFESGSIDANRPRLLTPVDQITTWWSGLNQRVFDPVWARNIVSAQLSRGNMQAAQKFPELNEPWLGSQMPGVIGTGVSFFYNNGDSDPSIVRIAQPQNSHAFAIRADGVTDGSIDSFVFGQAQIVAGLNEYSINADADARARGVANPYPNAAKNFYKDLHLTDPSIFDFYNTLIDGHNKAEMSDWNAANLSLSQTFWKNRAGFELVADFQDYETENYSLLGYRTFLSVDINTHTMMIPATYPGAVPNVAPDPSTIVGGDPNPNVGRAYVSGNRPRSGRDHTVRENYRFTGFLELYGSDIFRDDSFLARLIGRNVFTGLLNRDEVRLDRWQWLNFAMDVSHPLALGRILDVDASYRDVGYVVYLSDDLRSVSSARNLNLPGVQSFVSPSGPYGVQIFDSHWNAPAVNPADPYIIPYTGMNSSQAENWQNYVGLSTLNTSVLNAREGDQDDLMTSGNKLTQVIESQGLTWQGYWWDGMTIPTVGWRRDKIQSWQMDAPLDPLTKVRSTNFDNVKPANTPSEAGETVTWGVVQHTDRWLARRLPRGTNFSFFYNDSENFLPEVRYGYSGSRLPAPTGNSKDYGIVMNTLDDRLTLKVTWYETKVKDANLGGGNPLGDAVWFLWNVPKLGTAAAVKAAVYWAGADPTIPAGQVNYGMVDANKWGQAGWVSAPFSEEALNHPSNVKLFAAIEDWFATMLPQSFYDAYGFAIDTSKAGGSVQDLKTMIDNGNWPLNSGAYQLPSTGNGRVYGADPVITIDNASEGIEFELQYRPVRNWNITVNASKTKAYRENLGQDIRDLVEYMYNRLEGPAGDLRVGWGGDVPLRNLFLPVYAAYQFQLDANGQSAAEIRPWRFNLISNYSFIDGPVRGLSIGGAVRWQDDAILGYRLDAEQSKLDVMNPIYGGAETNIDLWAAYQKKLTDKVTWKIQVNVRNAGKDYGLIPVSVNPDGTPATYRISQGMTWSVTNTFMF